RSGGALPGAGSRRVAETVLHPPVRSRLARPGSELLAFISAGLLPSELRHGYGIRWTPAHAAAHRGWCVWFRTMRPALPRRLRISPVYDLALARSEGRWPAGKAA